MDIIVPKHIKPVLPKRQVSPSPDELILRCNSCGETTWRVFIKMTAPGIKVEHLVCANERCQMHGKVDTAGLIDGSGKITRPDGGKLS